MGRILIVDDEPSMRDVLSSLLKAQGHEITACDNGHDAVAQVESGEPFDLLVSDIRMNPMSGIDVLDKVSKLDPDLPVIMVSAYATEDTRQMASAMGARAMMDKPFNMMEFLAAVKAEMRNT